MNNLLSGKPCLAEERAPDGDMCYCIEPIGHEGAHIYTPMPPAQMGKRIAELEAENKRLRAGIAAVSELIDESAGVAGLHLNGDMAPWVELLEGGRFEDWLVDFSEAVDS